MYEEFYHLKGKPFQLVPNPALLYRSPEHENALIYLEYGLREKLPFILLTGEIGTGKTTLIRHLLNKMEKHLDIAIIFNTKVTSEELLSLILQEFELPSRVESKAKSLEELYQFLIGRYAQGRGVLLIIDEAQNLSSEVLEDVRMLSNLQSDEHILLQIMLVGQPELKEKLNTSPRLAQLTQRISVSYHLTALNREETMKYIHYRLRQVDSPEELFTQDAIDLIHQYSAGIPRTINLLCESALVYGYADELQKIDADVIRQIIEDRGGMSLGVDGEQRSEQAASGPRDDTAVLVIEKMDALRKVTTKIEEKLDSIIASNADMNVYLAEKKSLHDLIRTERRRSELLFEHYGKLQKKHELLQETLERLKREDEEKTMRDGDEIGISAAHEAKSSFSSEGKMGEAPPKKRRKRGWWGLFEWHR